MGGDHNRVIVIGSGVSGLACARELVQRGYQVLVVEARSRVGGRLKGEPLQLQPTNNGGDESTSSSSSLSSSPQHQAVDLGGALIHGIEGNPIHAITTQMGVPLHEISDYCLLLDENGWPFDPKVDEKLSVLFNECLDLTFQRASADKHSERTFGDLFDEVCREKGVKNNHPLLKWHQANLELPTGADFHGLGYTWNDDEPFGFEGAHAAPETSWKFVMDNLASGLDILYNSPVTRIQVVLPDGTTPTSECPGPPVPVVSEEPAEKTDEPEELPVRVITRTEWRRSTPKKPTVSPARKSRRIRGEDVTVRRSDRSTKGVIQKLTVGHEQGVFSYDEPDKKPISSNRKRKKAGSDGEGNGVRSSTVQVTLQNGTVLEADAVVCTMPLGVLKVPPKSPGHINFVPPLPPAKRNAIRQLGCGLLNKCAISFPSVFWQDSEFLGLAENEHSYLVLNAVKYTGKPILIFMYGGSFAKELESWSDTAVVEDCLSVLKRICGKEVPSPVDYCVTRWGKEQFSRMAFTYIPPGVDGHAQLVAAGEAIHDPALPEKPLLMFAGEHTTPYHPSTMHGAFLSGIREAYRYDIFVAPELNDNMKFETDHKMYEFTFPAKRVFRGASLKKKKKEAAPTSPAPRPSQIRSRRHRFANMALRKAPAKRVLPDIGTPAKSPSKKKAEMATPDTAGSRRSQRSVSAKKAPELLDSPGEKKSEIEVAEEHRKKMDALEDRTLIRALDSYGSDFALARSKLLPVFGSSRTRSVDQIRQRWQQIAGRKTPRPEVSLKEWEAKTVAPAVSIRDNGFYQQQNRDENDSDGNSNRRRSNRETQPKILQDV